MNTKRRGGYYPPKMGKRILGLAITICMLMAFMPMIASAEYGTKYGDLYYETDNNDTEVVITDCTWSVEEVIIPSEINGLPVTTIISSAFFDCYGLKSITIPDSVTSIGANVFKDCVGLTNISVDENNKNYCSVDGILFNKDKTNLIKYPREKTNSSYTIPVCVTDIGYDAFSFCKNLTSITIPDSVTRIGNGAFYSCTALTDVTIPDSVTRIDAGAFSRCQSLASITIPDSITSIGAGVFSDTPYYDDESNWEDGVLYIGNYLLEANDDNITAECTVKNGTKIIADCAFWNCYNLTSVIIPNGVISIGDSTFAASYNLTSVSIANSVKSIGDSAFWSCYKLTSVNIPNDLTSIGNYVFYECYQLKSITIPDSITSIYEWAFCDCGLTSITISDSVTSISKGAFAHSLGLTDVYYSGTETQWKAISIDDKNDALTNATVHYNYVQTTPNTYEIGEITPTETGVTFTVTTNENVSGKQAAIVACYDENDIFIGLQQQQITASAEAQTISVEIDKTNTKTVKAFIWNALGYMMPASQPQSLEL